MSDLTDALKKLVDYRAEMRQTEPENVPLAEDKQRRKDNQRGRGRLFRRRHRNRKTGEWVESAIWWVQIYRGGKSIRVSSKTTSRPQADRFRKNMVKKYPAGCGVPARLKFKDLADLIVRDYTNNKRRSLARVKGAIRNLQNFFGGYLASEIDKQAIEEYTNRRLGAGLAANATVKFELSALKRMFRLARSIVGQAPEFPTIHVSNARQGFFEEPAFRAVLDHLEEDLRPAMVFAYLTGWRMKSEIFRLQWPQVDFAAGEIRLEPGTTKTDEGRTFPFSVMPELEELLKAQRAHTDQVQRDRGEIIPWVFHRRGRQIRDIRKSWKLSLEAAKIGKRIPHDFRRTAVRNLERAGVPRSVAMKLVGHKTEAIYRRYAIVAKQDLTDGLKKLAEFRVKMRQSEPENLPFGGGKPEAVKTPPDG
jgi:integrase